MCLPKTYVAVFLSFVLTISVLTPQAATTSTQSPQRDAQALIVIRQALAVAGGVAAINGIEDYTATGSITYHFAQEISGPVTVRGRGLDQIRVDANLPAGVRAEIMSQGEITLEFIVYRVGQHENRRSCDVPT